MRIAVTGARGFLGRNVTAALAGRGHQVCAVDQDPPRDTATDTETDIDIGAGSGVRQAVLDITDPDDVRELFHRARPEVVIHLAATTMRADAADLAAGIRTNVAGTQAILDAARECGVRRCLVSSSTAVFGDTVYRPANGQRQPGPTQDAPVAPERSPGPTEDAPVAPTRRPCLAENTPVAPTSAYGISKVAAETLVWLHNAAYPHPSGVVARLPALFGPWEHPTRHRALMSPPRQLTDAAATQTPVVLAEGGDRDWTYAPDVAEALTVLAEAPQLAHSLYHLGVGQTWNLRLLAEALAERRALDYTVGPHPTLEYGDDLRRNRVALDATRIRDELGVTFRPPARACRGYLDWLDTHPRRPVTVLSARGPGGSHLVRETARE